jgi:hypothetical protein
VIIRALVAVRHREGPLHYIEIGVRVLFCAPLALSLLFFLLSNTTSRRRGGYVMYLIGGGLDALVTTLIVGGFVNVFCCYVILRTLVAIVAPLRRKTDPAAPGGQELN